MWYNINQGGIMKANYENWMPKTMVDVLKYLGTLSIAIFLGLFAYIFLRKFSGFTYIPILSIVDIVFLVVGLILLIFYAKFKKMREAFSFENENSVSWNIINYVADKMKLEEGSKILDVGCGSGALSIAVAKNNQKSQIVGIDKWGLSYKSFSKLLCEKNAECEDINNVEFVPDDAVKLTFEDETFDGLVSNYVYHNIPGNRQKYLLESFRVLKKGGTFAIHDLFIKAKYGDMDKFIGKLKEMGFEKVELIDTDCGEVMDYKEAKSLMLTGSKLLYGVK